MIVGFSKHGTGGGAGPVDYVTDRKREGREEFEPVTVRGDAEQTKQLIDSLDFKWKYTSGVLSFAPDEVITPEMESDIIDRFESVAFAGLENDQYNILWVRHSHAGHHELHFVTPRVELATGKSLNVKPPGERAREHFDDYRSEVNAKYGLADPADPDRAKNVSTPDHELKIAAEALRKGEKAPDNMRELIDGVLTQRAVRGLIESREDVLNHVKQLGLETTREGNNYITVSDPNSTGRWRLKGGLYAKDFEPSAAIERANIARERDYSKPNEAAAREFATRVERHISARAEYNQSRYQTTKRQPKLVHDIKQIDVAIHHRGNSLHGYLWRELGNDGIYNIENNGKLRSNIGSKQENRETESLQRESIYDKEGILFSPSERNKDKNHLHVGQKRTGDSLEVTENDRARKPLIERLEEFRDSIQRATTSIRSRTASFAKDVQTYLSREQEAGSPSNKLKYASRGIEQSTVDVSKGFQQEVEREKQAHRAGHSLGR
jgi:hypothetical protein